MRVPMVDMVISVVIFVRISVVVHMIVNLFAIGRFGCVAQFLASGWFWVAGFFVFTRLVVRVRIVVVMVRVRIVVVMVRIALFVHVI